MPHLNREWIYMVFMYCEISPLPFDEIFDNVLEAIQKKDFAIIFRGPEGWDMLLIIERQWYSKKLRKKFFVEDHCFAVLEIVFRDTKEQRATVLRGLIKKGGNP